MAWATPLWTLGAVGIYVYEDKTWNKEAIWARIEVINGTEELHYYGSKKADLTISGYIRSKADMDTLRGYCESSTSRTLTGPNSFSESCKVVSVRAKRRPDKTDVTASLYIATVELIVV